VRDVVREELRRQAVDRIGHAGSDRDQRRRGSPDERDGIRGNRNQAEEGERRHEAGAGRVVWIAIRRGPCEQRDPGRDRGDAEHLASADRLPQHPDAEAEEDDQARGQCRLHERQRDQHERADLCGPSRQREAGADQPHGAADKADNERGAEGVLFGNLAGLPGLERDRGPVQHGGAQRREDSGEDEH
jgi:hypothetical protein